MSGLILFFPRFTFVPDAQNGEEGLKHPLEPPMLMVRMTPILSRLYCIYIRSPATWALWRLMSSPW